MPRIVKHSKPIIYVFCEGKSEVVYTKFLKDEFHEVVSIQKPIIGLFEEARDKFSKDRKFRNAIEVIDEIWFFFDIEKDQKDKWYARYEIIQKLRKLRKNPNIRIRLLMTTACIEYWFMLHYKFYIPYIKSTTDKEHILSDLRKYEPHYQKGDFTTTTHIASHYHTAIENGAKTLAKLLEENMPEIDDTDKRNQWLYKSDATFSTVQEAIQYLESLKNNL